MKRLIADMWKANTPHTLGAYLFAITLPMHQQMATWSLGLWMLLSLYRVDVKAIRFRFIILVVPALYVSYLLPYLFTPAESLHFLGHKLSLIAFPALFIMHPYSLEERKFILKYFSIGLTLAGVACLFYACYQSFSMGDGQWSFNPAVNPEKGFLDSSIYGGNYFFGSHLSLFHQTVYFSMYLCVGIATLLQFPGLFKPPYRWFQLGFFVLLIFLVSNKAGFLCLILIAIAVVLRSNQPRRLRWMWLALTVTGVSLVVLFNPRFRSSVNKLTEEGIRINPDARYDFTTRVLSWDAAMALLSERPVTGYGAGNIQTELDTYYARKGYKVPLQEHFNAHNQFLQIGLENGILGLVLFSYILLQIFGKANHLEKGTFGILIGLIFLGNSLFESILNRFSGIVLFAFLTCLLLVSQQSQKN